MGCHFLLQEIFPIQGSKVILLHLLHWQADLYHCTTWEASAITEIYYKKVRDLLL